MNINYYKPPALTFKDLSVGEGFQECDTLEMYIRSPETIVSRLETCITIEANSVNLHNGTFAKIADDRPVKRISVINVEFE